MMMKTTITVTYCLLVSLFVTMIMFLSLNGILNAVSHVNLDNSSFVIGIVCGCVFSMAFTSMLSIVTVERSDEA